MRRPPADHAVREQAACAIDQNTFLDAGAGCGKTQALTDRYLKLLEAGLAVREIVAVTFTNKAARDMKARLRERCLERAREATDDAAAEVWLRRAQELENAPISTIHSFCSSLLRRHAIRADLDPQFALMDEIQQRLLLAQTVRESLLRQLDAEEQSAALVVSQLRLAGAQDAIAKLIGRREDRGPELSSPPSAADLLRRWRALDEHVAQERLDLLIASPDWQECSRALREHVSADPSDKLEVLRRQMLECCQTAENRSLPRDQRLDALRRLQKLGNFPGKGNGWADDTCCNAVVDACRNMKNAGRRPSALIRELCDEEGVDSAPAAALTAAVLLEAHHALAAFEQAKARDSLLDYDDLQLLARNLLRDNARVRHDCHDRYRHMLVDEFQDTNGLQKELLWLAAGAEPASAAPPGRLFVVGDAKQSIYRFRDADVSVFDQTREEFRTLPGHACLRLEVTFRNRPAVSALHNEMFLQPDLLGPDYADRPAYAAYYEPLTPHRLTQNHLPPCDLLLVASDNRANGAEWLRQKEALAIAEWVKQAVGTLPVYDRDGEEEIERKLRPGDIALLFRATSDLRLYERALRLHGLKYHVSSGRGFFTRQEVLDLLNVLSALENWRDEVALAGVLRSPLFGLSDETLYWLKTSGGQLHEELARAAQGTHPHQSQLQPAELDLLKFAHAQLTALHEIKNRLPLSSLLAEILTRTGYTAALAGLFMGEQMLSNIRKLIDIARGFEASGSYSLRDFVDYLRGLVVAEERMGEAPTEEEDADCLKLMTVHAAKGLEWRVTIIPDLARGQQQDRTAGWRYHPRFGLIAAPIEGEQRLWPPLACLMAELEEAEELAEFKRLYYVAATRCRDHLVLSAAVGVRGSGGNWLEMLSSALDVDVEAATCPSPLINTVPFAAEDLAEPRPAPRAQQERHTPPPAEVLQCRLQPVPLDHASLSRFTVTGLAVYRACPARYALQYLEGLPESLVHVQAPQAGLSSLQRGALVHRALEIIGSSGSISANQALDLALQVSDLPPAEHQSLLAMLNWYLDSPVYEQRIRGACRLRSEMPLYFSLGGGLIEGKLDAVAERDDAGVVVDVLDYKTGYENEAPSQAEHVFQLGLYCAGLGLMGKQVRSATVVYLDGRREVAVADADIATAAADAAATVAAIRAGAFDLRAGAACESCPVAWACRQH